MYKIELDKEELYQVEHCIREGIKDCENCVWGYEGKRDVDAEIKHTLENVLNQIEKVKREE